MTSRLPSLESSRSVAVKSRLDFPVIDTDVHVNDYTPAPGVGAASPADNGYAGGFASALMLKDLKLSQEAAQAAGASSFCSAVVREPLRGHEVALPVPRRQELWVSSPAAVVENLMRVRDTPASWFAARGRVVNLPGATVTVQQVLDALRDVGGESALALVRDRRDERVEAVVAGWPTRLDTQHAWMLGMTSDVGLAENVRTFAKRYGLLPSSTAPR